MREHQRGGPDRNILHFTAAMQPQQIRTVAVVGCGVIGASWTCLFLSRGLKVIIIDPAKGAEETFKKYLRDAWPALQENEEIQYTLPENYEFVEDIKTRLPEVDFVQEVAQPVARQLRNHKPVLEYMCLADQEPLHRMGRRTWNSSSSSWSLLINTLDPAL